MSILSSIGRLATEFSAARSRYQTERAIHSLPIELQKDIGWPEAADTRTGRPRCRILGWSKVNRVYQSLKACRRVRQAFSICIQTISAAMLQLHDAYETRRIARPFSS